MNYRCTKFPLKRLVPSNFPSIITYNMNTYLNNHSFEMVPYQRNYDWDTQNAIQFMDSIYKVVLGLPRLYFGNVIVMSSQNSSENRNALVDGQQRTCTAALFLANIRNLAKFLQNKILDHASGSAVQKSKIWGDLQELIYAINTTLFKHSSEHTDKNLLVKIDNVPGDNQCKGNIKGYFDSLIINDNRHPRKLYWDSNSEPISKLHNMYSIIQHSLKKHMFCYKTNSDKVKFLRITYQAFMNHFYIGLLQARTHAEALHMFLTINETGKKLDIASAVKSHLASIYTDAHINYAPFLNKWNNMTKSLGGSKKTSRYLVNYWKASHAEITKTEVAHNIIDTIKEPSQASTMTKELLSLLPVYQVWSNPKSFGQKIPQWRSIVTPRIVEMKNIKFKQCLPLLLAISYKHFSPKDIAQILDVIIGNEIRAVYNGTNHKKYNRIAQYVWKTSNITVQDVLLRLQETKHRLNSDDKTYNNCMLYKQNYHRSGTQFLCTADVLAHAYAKQYGDFQNGHNILKDLIAPASSHKRQKYMLVNITHNSPAFHNSLGNITLLESKLYDKYRNDPQGLKKAFRLSGLKGNKILANQLQLSGNANNFIQTRTKAFAQDVISNC